MAEQLKGRIVHVEKAVTAQPVLDAVETLHDLNPHFTRGPGRKLGL
jgi:hypothetical protein